MFMLVLELVLVCRCLHLLAPGLKGRERVRPEKWEDDSQWGELVRKVYVRSSASAVGWRIRNWMRTNGVAWLEKYFEDPRLDGDVWWVERVAGKKAL